MSFPDELSGHMISFVKPLYQFETSYNAWKDIPTYFWSSRVMHNLPLNPKMRRRICIDVFDLDHHTYCIDEEFHPEFKEGCVCVACLKPICAYHKYSCKPKHPKVIITPLKLPDNWFQVTKIPPKDIENEIRNKNTAEENSTLNFLEIRRNSKRTIKLNSKFTGDDWINQ